MAYKRLGIAGYMGAGKSTAARFLAEANTSAVIIDADYEAKAFMATDTEIRRRLVTEFGSSIIERNLLSFSALGRIVFGSREKLLKLNAIVHPPFVQYLFRLLRRHTGNPVVLDAALLPLWDMESQFDACLWIHATSETRLDRLKRSHNDFDEHSLLNRMRLQEEVLAVPDCPPWRKIDNEGSRERLSRSVAALRL
jgi:dephospho-CoA kinase